MPNELKPCPFCGNTDLEVCTSPTNSKKKYIRCRNDLCHYGAYTQKIDREMGWNKRPIEAALQARIAELERAAVKWHKYPDEKPPESGFYIVCCENDVFEDWFNDGTDDCVGDEYIDHTRGLYCDPIWGTTRSADSIIPTHWAYLPAPPEEVSND